MKRNQKRQKGVAFLLLFEILIKKTSFLLSENICARILKDNLDKNVCDSKNTFVSSVIDHGLLQHDDERLDLWKRRCSISKFRSLGKFKIN